jgi:DASS family divalent anion:Na+ symporter
MLLSAGVPSMLAALSLCWLSSLYSGVSHFASGQGAVYAGSGYISIPEIFKWGAIIGAVNVIGIWGIIGSFWWRFIGLV